MVEVEFSRKNHEATSLTKEEMFIAIRTDKGNRIAAGIELVKNNSVTK